MIGKAFGMINTQNYDENYFEFSNSVSTTFNSKNFFWIFRIVFISKL